jgi:hypothetical protein
MKEHDCLYRLMGRCNCSHLGDKPFCKDYVPAWQSIGNIVTYIPSVEVQMREQDRRDWEEKNRTVQRVN